MLQAYDNGRTAEQDIYAEADYEEFCSLIVWVQRDTGCSLRKRSTSSEEIECGRGAAVISKEASHDGRMSISRLVS